MLNRIAFGWRIQRDGGLQGIAPGGGGSPVSYLLYDQYTTARAGGAVNGTSAEPGGTGTAGQNTRTVTDTNSKLSITGAQLSAATGGVGSGDPGLWYGSFARLAGRILIASLTTNSVTGRPGVGWDLTASGAIQDSVFFLDSTSLDVSINGTNRVVGVIAQATAYSVAVIMRANGFWYLIKGGAFTNWSLLTTSLTGNAAGLPAVGQSASGTTTIFVADDLRVPVSVYILPILAYDTFTRADGALGSTETTGPDSQVATALAWTGTTYTISTNKAINTPALGSEVIINGGFGADTDWNKGAGWTIAAGTAVATAASSDITAAVAPLALGTWYQTVFTQGGFAGGTANVKLGTTAFPTHGANGTFTETGRATSTAFALTGAGLTDTIDNVSAKALTLANLFASVVVSTADIIAEVNVTLESASSGKQAGLVLNLDSTGTPANFITVYLDGNGNCKADECVAGTYTNKISAAVTYSAAATLKVIRVGTDLRVFYNDAAVGALATMTANTNLRHGLFNTSPLSSLDVFNLWPRGTSNEFTTLNGY